MSGGSQHNPNGRQSQLGSGWSPLQLQVANFLARAPQVHMAADRGVTWHTPTPPPHLYHVPAPSPPDPLQAMKTAGSNSVYRHTATPPELYRHTPTPPDKHLLRHTPSPGDVKDRTPLPQPDLYPHLGPGREKLRPEELLAYARVGVDLSLGSRTSNGSPGPTGALSVRDAPTINSLIARAQPRHHLARVDALLERLAPADPPSVIVHPRLAPTPSPPSSNEDSADSCGAPPGSKRKRKPERTLRVPVVPPQPRLDPPAAVAEPPQDTPATPLPTPACPQPNPPPPEPVTEPPPAPSPPKPIENGDTPHQKVNGPEKPPSPQPERPPTRRKTRSGSAETIDDIAAMIASTDHPPEQMTIEPPKLPETPVATVDTLKSVLASPEPKVEEARLSPKLEEKPEQPETTAVESAAAPRRRSARTSNSESANVPVESPSEAKPAEPESEAPTAEPVAASFVEVENQLEKMFAGIEEEPLTESKEEKATAKAKKRRKSAPTKGERKAARRAGRASTDEGGFRRKAARKKEAGKAKKKDSGKDAYDSGSNASSSRSRGPYIQIRGPCSSPVSVSVINAAAGEEDTEGRRREEFRNGVRVRGLHASTLGLRYDASTADATWTCAFCGRGPHALALGDLFGPYAIDDRCHHYRELDSPTRARYPAPWEVWTHAWCAVWADGVLAAGARVWGLRPAVWAARGAQCGRCGARGAAVACTRARCTRRAHAPCADQAGWALCADTFRAFCPDHLPDPPVRQDRPH